jgi:hypothetical protein
MIIKIKKEGYGLTEILYEEQLYDPVKKYFVKQEFEVKAEVKNCDITAMRDGKMVIVELKKILNLDVILQAAERQKICDVVYIAVPRKERTLKRKRMNDIINLLKRLGIGLLLVSINGTQSLVQEVLSPSLKFREQGNKISYKKRKAVCKEFKERSGDYNIGGSVRKKIQTAYKEKAVYIAVLLRGKGPLSIKELKELGSSKDKTSKILQDNYYQWFFRVKRGVYDLTDKGNEEVELLKETFINLNNDFE